VETGTKLGQSSVPKFSFAIHPLGIALPAAAVNPQSFAGAAAAVAV